MNLAKTLPAVALLLLSGSAHAVTLNVHGTGTARPAPVAPATDCSTLRLFAADTSSTLQRYRFSGECRINVAPAGKAPVVRTVPVRLDAEWFPQMKRASETLLVDDPDLGVELTTWATCPSDPFVAANVTCASQGIGANKFSAFLRERDVPFAHGRTTRATATAVSDKIGADRSKLYAPVRVASLQPISAAAAGAKTEIAIDVTGGVGICPLTVDFGDGSIERVWGDDQQKGTHRVSHTFAKPGVFTVRARALPGCAGQAQGTASVASGMVQSIDPGLPVKVGQSAGIKIHGAGATCSVHIDYGDGGAQDFPNAGFGGATSSMYLWRVYDKPGTYQVKVQGIQGCLGSATHTVEVKGEGQRGLPTNGLGIPGLLGRDPER